MQDNVVEKKFLYLVLLSIIVHGAIFFLLLNLPQEKAKPPAEPLMVDLEGIPTLPPPPTITAPVTRQAEEAQRVEREAAPKGEDLRGKPALPPALKGSSPSLPEVKGNRKSPTALPSDADVVGRSSRDELFRKKGPAQKLPEMASLYPGASRLAKMEESYRKKYGPEVAEGETRFLNTDDIQFGSFLRRFETSVYGVWRYPAEAVRMGIEGMTPVRITFNRRGEIVSKEVLQSSGSKILDNEVLRTLDQIGPIGGFPKGYDKETFNLIAFFHYGIMQGAVRSLR